VAAITGAKPENRVLFLLRSWLAALSHTRPVEKIFLDYDHQSRTVGVAKKKATEASGKGGAPDLLEAKVRVASEMHKLQQQVLLKSEKKRARLEAKLDTIAAVNEEYVRFKLTEEELQKARAEAGHKQEYFRQPRGGLSEEIRDVFAALMRDVDGWKGPRLDLASVLALGQDLDIALLTTCTADCLRLERQSKKGSPGSIVTCIMCFKTFHVKCMVHEKQIQAGLRKLELAQLQFNCKQCKELALEARVANEEQNVAAQQAQGGAESLAPPGSKKRQRPKKAQRKNK